MNITISPGGIYVAEESKPEPVAPPVPPEPDGVPCAVCGKRSVDRHLIAVCWRTSEGWSINWPCCIHGTYTVCPDCEDPRKCPQCGCEEMNT